MRRIKFTKEGLDQLRVEYEKLKADRPSAVKELTRARELGDLSENGLYHAAKARLKSIDGQLRRLSNRIKLAKIVPSQTILVEQGGPPRLGEAGKQITYEIVGDFEADPSQNKISANSPIGSSLINKNPGDTVEIQTPKGPIFLKVLKKS